MFEKLLREPVNVYTQTQFCAKNVELWKRILPWDAKVDWMNYGK